MADATKSQLLTRLNIKTRDGANVTFTAQEKNDALTTAINDPYVVSISRNTDNTTTVNGDSCEIPEGMTALEVGIQLNTYGRPTKIDGWSQYGTTVYLDEVPTAGKTLVIIGSTKLTDTDLIPDNRQEYVLTLAKLELVNYLKQSLASTFLTNDITMSELLALEQSFERDAEKWRNNFRTNYMIEL